MKLYSTIPAICLVAACATQPVFEPLPEMSFPLMEVAAVSETAPMTGQGDRADDPAIWVNHADPSASIILGTNKEEGLHVYNLEGEELQFLDVGRLNNVDLRGVLAAASNDEAEAISWFRIDEDAASVAHIGDTPVEKFEPYGICSGRMEGVDYAAVTYKDGTVQIWSAEFAANGAVVAHLARTAQLSSKLEGCVFDEPAARLFIGEEAVGVWSLDLSDETSEPVVVDLISNGNGLVEDTEGLSVWRGEDGAGYLIASAQAADRFVVYDRLPPHAPRGVFTVTASQDGTVDAVSHTDGLDVSSATLPGFPSGLLVVQDDANPAPEVDQNFKLVSWADVEAALSLNEK